MKEINGYYDPILVSFSFAIAVIASYTALDLARRVTPKIQLRSSLVWICGGAVAMGTGIWSMHFIAMLALKLPISVSYDVPLTLLSWGVAILASGFALVLFSSPKLNLLVLLGGGSVMGLAIASMHYLGMTAVRMTAAVHYNLWLVALSVAIAIAASGTALWLAFQFRNSSATGVHWWRLCSAFVMGIAISGMHYTGMWATCFRQISNAEPIKEIDSYWLAIPIAIGTLMTLVGTLLTSLFDRLVTANSALQTEILERKQIEKALNKLTMELEKRVQERTKALEKTNQLLLEENRERKLTEEALQKSAILADQANRSKSEFLSSMSHELRTPLNAILGFSQVMVRDTSLNHQHQEHLEIINRAGEHLLSLINDILEMSKIEAGRSQLNQSSFNLMHLLETLEEMFRLKAESKKLQLNFEVVEGVPHFVNGDEGKLRQILINLVGNAIKFTETGSVTLRVKKKVEESLAVETAEFAGTQTKPAGASSEQSESLAVETASTQTKPAGAGSDRSAQADFDCVDANSIRPVFLQNLDCADANSINPEFLRLQFEIEDTGPGIAAEEMNKLFDPFEQTKTGHKSQQGTGLGLSISRNFVQMMGGDITIGSIPGLGSRFAFDIEIRLAEPADVKIVKLHKKVISLAPNQPQYRILVVDDRADNCLVIDRLLSPLGILVREARNGQEAIAIWEEWQPHLIWMDMQMPVMNGYEATRQIKAHSLGKKTAIVALTASVFEEERQTILAAGCDDFMRKPFEAKILFAKLEELLGVRYIYEETVEAKLENESEISGGYSNLSVESQLGKMPLEWVEKISDAAHECCDDKIIELIEEMPREFAATAQVLTTLVHDFLFDDIIELAKSGVAARQ